MFLSNSNHLEKSAHIRFPTTSVIYKLTIPCWIFASFEWPGIFHSFPKKVNGPEFYLERFRAQMNFQNSLRPVLNFLMTADKIKFVACPFWSFLTISWKMKTWSWFCRDICVTTIHWVGSWRTNCNRTQLALGDLLELSTTLCIYSKQTNVWNGTLGPNLSSVLPYLSDCKMCGWALKSYLGYCRRRLAALVWLFRMGG